MQDNEQAREELYEKATLDVLKTLARKQIEKNSKEDEKIGLKLKNELNKDVGDIILIRTKKYVEYLQNKFIPRYHGSVYDLARQFFPVLELSGFIQPQDSSNLFDEVMKRRYGELSKNLVTKRINLQPTTQYDPSSWETLNDILMEIYQTECDETQKVRDKSEQVWKEFVRLFNMIDFSSMKLPNVHLIKYGSSENIFQTTSSDFDVTILTDSYVDERAMLKVIKEYFEAFKENGDFVGEIADFVIKANVRIPHMTLKLKGCEFDLTINNILGVVNTRLLDVYGSIDKRCAQLGVLVKLWAKAHDLCSGKDFLSSYSYVLMTINFLQILTQPILPSVQKMAMVEGREQKIQIRRILDNQVEDNQIANVAFLDDLGEIKRKFQSYGKNQAPLGRLLLEFFTWYEKLLNSDESMWTLSIREGCLKPRMEKWDSESNRNPKNYVYSIEDPFDETHDPGRNFKRPNKDKDSEGRFYKFKTSINQTQIKFTEFLNGKIPIKTIKELFKKGANKP